MLINTVPIVKSKHPGRSCCRPTLSVALSLSGGAEVLLQEHPEAAGKHHHHFISGGCWEQTYIYYAALSKADFRHPILLHLGLSKGLSPPIRRDHLPQHNRGVASQGCTGPWCLSPWGCASPPCWIFSLELSEDVSKRAALPMPSHSLIKLRQGLILSVLHKSKEKGRNKKGAVPWINFPKI